MKVNKVGLRFGKLVVKELAEPYVSPKGIKLTQWLCQCDCGKEKVIVGCSLNKIQSCGCIVGEFHGMSSTRTYKAYTNMKDRVYNKENYPAHAAKGIGISEEWNSSFSSFYSDMGDCPEGYSLERRDTEGDYTKDNCIWIEDWGVQCYNKSLSSKNQTGVTGVSWSKVSEKWHAYINKDGKRVHLGLFEEFEDAVSKRKEAEIEYYGFHLKE